MLAISIYPIDPVAFSFGPVEIKWYGLSYVVGLLLGWLYVRNLIASTYDWPCSAQPFLASEADDLLVYIAIGVVVGGRLGFVLLYEPSYYYNKPWDIFAVWQGGMAFHGALLGCGLAVWIFTCSRMHNPLSVMDFCSAAAPIGLFFGRIANFINGELWGRPTDMPWGIIFPAAQYNGNDSTPVIRHPSQLYEAVLEGLVLFLILRLLVRYYNAIRFPGFLTGVFLVGYGLTRSFCEFFRQPDLEHFLSFFAFTPGIVYSVPMILLGLWFIRSSQTKVMA
ncbi:MAG: prolipoprotein diacylglyceryl transferase [Hyphomicrobiaceae bacterium]|nr:prolipoprotein diacylglyceryl transferase [Hyphomicrobiaceae bacterium]